MVLLLSCCYNERTVPVYVYSTKSVDFLRFYFYFCHVIDDFACLDLQH